MLGLGLKNWIEIGLLVEIQISLVTSLLLFSVVYLIYNVRDSLYMHHYLFIYFYMSVSCSRQLQDGDIINVDVTVSL